MLTGVILLDHQADLISVLFDIEKMWSLLQYVYPFFSALQSITSLLSEDSQKGKYLQ